MTLRLVALMTLVLALTLAAFALLMGAYQQHVMREVQDIVSAVGKETVRSLELASSCTADATQAEGVRVARWVDRLLASVDERTSAAGHLETRPTTGGHDHGFAWFFVEGEAPQVVSFGDPATAGARGGEEERSPALERVLREFAVEEEAGSAPATRVLVHVEAVRAEGDPDRGMVLRIPTLARRPTSAGEIVLTVPVKKLEGVAQAARRQSLVLFLGALGVGMVLATGFAHHFTRPVRRLDAALHRLAEGDLDVRVHSRGSDEVGRLSRAFNEMADRLRAGREEARERARREKLAALGRLAAGVAHDVRNPLHSIGLTVEHLREACRPPDGPTAHEFERSLGLIRDEIRRLDQLVQNFLAFARSDRTSREPLDAGALLAGVARLVRREAGERGITLEVDAAGAGAPEEAPAAPVVKASVEAAVLNLVLNAFEATGPGGRVTLRARREPGEIRLEVEDTGRGIPVEDQERVFEFRWSGRPGGQGLGLAMVHQVVVEDHGGRVELWSDPGQGTRVGLRFPAGPATVAPPEPP